MKNRVARLALLLVCASLTGCGGALSTQPAERSAATPPADGTLVWRLDDLHSIAGKAPELLGAPQLLTDNGRKVVHFNGTDEGLILPLVPIAGMKAFTMQVLFKPESGGPAEQRFIHSEDDVGERFTFETRLTPAGQWSLDTFLLSANSRLTLLDTTRLHPADRWYWVALRYDGATMTSFINGVKELEGPVAFPPMHDTGRIAFGVRLNHVSWFKGCIGELRITPSALPESALLKVP
jgi:hypothetical protein